MDNAIIYSPELLLEEIVHIVESKTEQQGKLDTIIDTSVIIPKNIAFPNENFREDDIVKLARYFHNKSSHQIRSETEKIIDNIKEHGEYMHVLLHKYSAGITPEIYKELRRRVKALYRDGAWIDEQYHGQRERFETIFERQLGQPEKALHELTIKKSMRRILHAEITAIKKLLHNQPQEYYDMKTLLQKQSQAFLHISEVVSEALVEVMRERKNKNYIELGTSGDSKIFTAAILYAAKNQRTVNILTADSDYQFIIDRLMKSHHKRFLDTLHIHLGWNDFHITTQYKRPPLVWGELKPVSYTRSLSYCEGELFVEVKQPPGQKDSIRVLRKAI